MKNMKNSLIIFSLLCLVAYVAECLSRRGYNNSLHKFLKSRNMRKQSNLPLHREDYSNDSNLTSFYVESQKSGKEADKIVALPGLLFSVRFSQYSGYVTVDPKAGRALFYYFVQAENPTNKPLVLWLNGGPGCSSIGYGAMSELGPFRVNSDGKTLSHNKCSWNTVANVLFLESPAGVGFSYSNRSSDYVTGDNKTAADSYTFLVNWFKRFPEYKTRPFYIMGQGYGGHYVPQLADLILNNNKKTSKHAFYINLRGIAIGNPMIDALDSDIGISDYWLSHALISNDTYQGVQKNCEFDSHKPESTLCRYYIKQWDTESGNIDANDIYAPLCGSSSEISTISNFDPCTKNYVVKYLNNPYVQKALHANTTHTSGPWDGWNYDIYDKYTDDPDSVLPVIKSLITSGLRVWIYSGDTDAVDPFTGTLYSLTKLGLPIKTQWHPWYANEEVGGYAVEYENAAFLTVRGAGHDVPSYQPERALVLFTSFLKGQLPPGKNDPQI